MYPEVNFINGFCYMISRRAIREVGFLDEINFPRGYGEEDDFSLRCAKKGLKMYIADDCYVFHSKSKSFTSKGRDELVKDSKGVLAKLHGKKVIQNEVEKILNNENLIRSREYISQILMRNSGLLGNSTSSSNLEGYKIGWLQPHLQECGGIRRAIEMSNRLVTMGAEVELITPDGIRTNWLPVRANVIPVVKARNQHYDVLICSDPDTVNYEIENPRLRIIYHLGPYMLYRKKNDALNKFYKFKEEIIHIANSSWIADQVNIYSGKRINIEGIFPGGIDKNLFKPIRVKVVYDVSLFGSERIHKGTQTIEKATKGMKLLRLTEKQVRQNELASLICSSRVFVSAAWHEGFNFCPLEAMACGVPVVMTDDGGSREYAAHEVNALVFEVGDEKTLRKYVERIQNEPLLKAKLIEEGLKTAYRFEWDGITDKFAEFILSKLAVR